MLKRIVAITLVALLSLALAGTSIADPKNKLQQENKMKERDNKNQVQTMETFKNVLQSHQLRSSPQQSKGPKRVPGAAGRTTK